LPKIKFFKSIYSFLSKEKNQVFSKAEILGRLVYSGFKIIDYKIINLENPLLFFIVTKHKDPIVSNPTNYGPIFKMQRVGKHGKMIGVYKIRTMHPYSEYLQSYVLKKYGNSVDGKIKNDFRLTEYSKTIRKFWIDEIPQIINVLKGDMNIFGPRPVSLVRFKQFPVELQNLRIRYKPGCIPAYLSFNYDSDSNSLIKSEFQYLNLRRKYGIIIHAYLILVAFYNIIFKSRRSS